MAVMVMLMIAGLGAQQSPKVSTGDLLKIVVLNVEMGATDFTVDSEGFINYPSIGKIKAAGFTATELGAAIGKQLVDKGIVVRAPQIMVDLKQLESKSVTIAGAVVSRGAVTFGGEISLFDALIKVGGPAADAGEDIVVTRRPVSPGADAETVIVKRTDIESGDFEKNVMLRDGDRVFIPKAEQVFISGYVNNPNGYVVPTGTTLRQAITLAGGVSELGAINRVKVTRKGKLVDDKLTKELDKFIVEPGDVIEVPKRKM